VDGGGSEGVGVCRAEGDLRRGTLMIVGSFDKKRAILCLLLDEIFS
jgi:hypothetical protein